MHRYTVINAPARPHSTGTSNKTFPILLKTRKSCVAGFFLVFAFFPTIKSQTLWYRCARLHITNKPHFALLNRPQFLERRRVVNWIKAKPYSLHFCQNSAFCAIYIKTAFVCGCNFCVESCSFGECPLLTQTIIGYILLMDCVHHAKRSNDLRFYITDGKISPRRLRAPTSTQLIRFSTSFLYKAALIQ